MIDILKDTVEYQRWGLNAATIGSLGTIFFTFLEGWGLYRQNKRIWREPEKAGESLSVIWFSYLCFIFLAFLFYGIAIKSVAIIISGAILGSMHFPVLLGLWKFKGYTRKEKKLFWLFFSMVPLMALLPWKNLMFIIFSFGAILSLSTQPWEIWRNKNAGLVEIRLIATYFISTLFWIIYAYAISVLAMQITTPICLLLFGITIVLWKKYK